ncbi:MAG TPA: hypothetical protein VFD70_29580 [Anaerolineae bacterium]|nr:hypothetical protein [Anaerolineae bacterium]
MSEKKGMTLVRVLAFLTLTVLALVTAPTLRAENINTYQDQTTHADAPLAKATNQITLRDYEAHIVTEQGDAWTSGKVTGYQAGDFIVFRFTVASNSAASGQFQVRFTGQTKKCLGFEDQFTFNALEYVSGDFPTVTLVGNPQTADFPEPENFGTPHGEWVVAFDVSFDAAGEARVYHILKLSNQAGDCTGATPYTRLEPLSDNVKTAGSQKLSVRLK